MLRAVLLLSLCAGLAPAAQCAVGVVPLEAGAEVAEVEQRALIAFSGQEQIMHLASVIEAKAATDALLIVPLPGEPAVGDGNDEGFASAAEVVRASLSRRAAKLLEVSNFAGQRPADASTEGPAVVPPARPPLKTRIVKAADQRTLLAETATFVAAEGGKPPSLPPLLSAAIDDYLRDGYRWFVLRHVELPEGRTTLPAMRVRFKTTRLFYPLRIGRSSEELTEVRLIMVSPRLVHIPDVGAPRVKLLHEPVAVGLDSLEHIDGEFSRFFEKRPSVLVRLWEAKGRPSGFKQDISTVWY